MAEPPDDTFTTINPSAVRPSWSLPKIVRSVLPTASGAAWSTSRPGGRIWGRAQDRLVAICANLVAKAGRGSIGLVKVV